MKQFEAMNNNLREGLRWLDQAEADTKTARDCLQAGNYYASAFLSQQAAEKGLKGFLYSEGSRALITPSVVDLVEEISKSQESFKKLIDAGKELDRHYIGSSIPTSTHQAPHIDIRPRRWLRHA